MTPRPSLSLVIPAYNEARRIEPTLATAVAFFEARRDSFELIVVDDGSTDGTAEIATRVAAAHPGVRVLSIPHGGKAAALRAGLQAATGELIGFSDADLATPLHHLDDLRAALVDGPAVAIGSREGIGARRIGEPRYRHLMGRVFNGMVRLLVLPGLQDTQCGFKLFPREAIERILTKTRLYADQATVTGPRVTAFDVELLVIARRLGYTIHAVPVVWTYGERSKVNPISDTWHNLRDVLQVRFNDWRGYYR